MSQDKYPQVIIKGIPPIKKSGLSDKHKDFILKKRAEILVGLADYLKECRQGLTREQVMAEVYETDDQDDFDELAVFLADDEGEIHIEEAQELAMELCNYFPRRSKRGYSLAEEMSFAELKEMEKSFQRFKNG